MVTSSENSGPVRDPETVAAAAEWARTADFATPLQWGAVEDAVLAQPLPGGGAGAGTAATGIVRTLVFGLVGCSALIGLALVLVLRGSSDTDLQDLAGVGAIVAFLVALALVVASAFIWWDTGRPRSSLGLAVSGVTGVASAVAFVAFLGASYDDDRSTLFIRVLSLGAAVVGLGLFGAILALGTPSTGQPRKRRLSLDMGKELRYVVARNTALDVLVERGLTQVDGKEKERIASMPLGSWHQLDSTQG